MFKSRTKRNQRELNLSIWQRNFARDKIPVKLAKRLMNLITSREILPTNKLFLYERKSFERKEQNKRTSDEHKKFVNIYFIK